MFAQYILSSLLLSKSMRTSVIGFLLVALQWYWYVPALQAQSTAQFGTKHGVIANSAMVVTAHPEATRVGIEILKKGGNAIDAGIAVEFALAVVYPQAGNIGGGGFYVIRMADGKTAMLDYRERAPKAATRTMYLDDKGNVREQASKIGHLAPGVPGTVAGMAEAHKNYGSLPWKDLVEPAIRLARHSTLTAKEAGNHNEVMASIEKVNGTHNAFVKKGGWKQGDAFVQADLAKTLERVRDHGRGGFYEGETADLFVAEMKRGGGIITHEDLQSYQATWRTPLTGTYKGYDIITAPPPSAGGIGIVQMLGMIENYEQSSGKKLSAMGFHSAEAVHLMTEIERRYYADRAEHMGDPDFYPVPTKGLVQATYSADRMKTFDPQKATPSSVISAGKPQPKESEQTTHYSIVDAKGNALSATTTLNGGYGSRLIVRGAGFILNNEMDDFSVKPGTPNMYGAVGGEANAIQPSKRMLSSMTPTILTKNGKLAMVVGTPGGTTITTSIFQVILNVLEFKMTMQEAVSAKRFHHQHLPDRIMIEENGLPSTVQETLKSMGHQFFSRTMWGRVEGVRVLPNGKYESGADPRGDDTALGY
jgi:gamma-glutamyltranspeptidase / glutathione hydrolase